MRLREQKLLCDEDHQAPEPCCVALKPLHCGTVGNQGRGDSFRGGGLWKASFKKELQLVRLRRGMAYQAEETANAKARWLERARQDERKGSSHQTECLLEGEAEAGWQRAAHTASESSLI